MTSDGLPSLSLEREETAPPPHPDRDPELFKGLLTRRIFAYCVDVLLIFVIGIIGGTLLLVLGVLSFGLLLPLKALALALLPLAYHTLFIGRYGATPGMSLFDLEVRSFTGGKPDYVQAFIMTALFYLSIAVTAWLVLIVVFFNERKRTMHDFFANVLVLRRRASQSPA